MSGLKNIRSGLFRRGCLIGSLLLLSAALRAQPFNNEWINYGQTYYKFKIGKTGLYRINRTALDAWGVGNTPVEFIELWRNGEKVAFYPSVPSGALPADGYLEFWGSQNDGIPDKPLYRDPAYQHTTVNSLIQDSATYFLSVNENRSGTLYTAALNPVAQNTLLPEPYFMHAVGLYYKNRINPGFAAVIGEYVYSSSYDKGEFWASGFIYPSGPFSSSLTNLYPNIDGPDASLHFGAAGCALNMRKAKVFVNNNLVADVTMDYFNDVVDTVSFPVSYISSGTAQLRFNNSSGLSNDRMVVSFAELNYPRNFNFGGMQNFEFSLPGKQEGYYIEISNFNYGSQPPVLYDLTQGRRYTGVLLQGKVAFALPSSYATSRFILVSQASASISAITSAVPRKFINYNAAEKQGDYVIVSHPSLNLGTNGRRPVDEYRDYRNSALGGGYKAIVVDVNEINDQFAFGISKHPLTVRNFIRFAKANLQQPVNDIFLIGRGMTYLEYRLHPGDSIAEKLNMVPTFGYPGSDNLLSSADIVTCIPEIPIGRLSAVTGTEVESYLEKVKEYETVQRSASNTINDRGWMKNLAQVTGASDPYLGTILCNYMGNYSTIAADTLWGANVSTFCKLSATNQDQNNSQKLKQLIEQGISALTYFGHSSATTLDFNIDNPQNYSNQGKYPVFFVNGCNAGNFFTYYPQRYIVNETLSEKFVLAKQRGSVAFVASTHFGIVNYLNIYLSNLYRDIGGSRYGSTLGQLNKFAIKDMLKATGLYDYYARTHSEQITLHGDPAVRMNLQPKPDYVLEPQLIEFTPSFISIAEEKFKVAVKVVNLGKSVADSVRLEVKRQYPDGTVATIFNSRIARINYMDSVVLELPIAANRDKGANKIIAIVDGDARIDEVAENNNSAEKDFFIYEDEMRPVFPYNFAITSDPVQKLFVSTANPFSVVRDYQLELDTTDLFNSPAKYQKSFSAAGGLTEISTGLSFKDSTVYYWRVAPVPVPGKPFQWNVASFIYMSGNKQGFNQSHYDQYKKITGVNMQLDSATRKWKFGNRLNNVTIRNGVFPTAATQAGDNSVTINDVSVIRSICGYGVLLFNVFDPVTLQPWFNADPGQPTKYGSDPVCASDRRFNFQYSLMDTASRRRMKDFMDLIPAGHYVTVRNVCRPEPESTTYASLWKSDTVYWGSNNTIYHRLMAQGFMDIDSFYRPRSFAFMYKKDRQPEFKAQSQFTEGIYDRMAMNVECYTPDTSGYILSPLFGPSLQWRNLVWKSSSLESPTADATKVEVIGVKQNGGEETVAVVAQDQFNVDLSYVDPVKYPYLRLKLRSTDTAKLTPQQLDFWRLFYDPVPEGAIAPNLLFASKDTLEIGEPLNFAVAFRNISPSAFDSLDIHAYILDQSNVPHQLMLPKGKPLKSGDTLSIRYAFETKNYPGANTLFVEVNPIGGQPEQYHFNNFLYRNFYVRPDKVNPLLDVTFDGVHILNRDIVSASPHIMVRLKDDAKYLLLNDTALASVQLRYPNGTVRQYRYNSDTLRFIPAASGAENTATIEFNPVFGVQTDPEGDEYELQVQGKDRSSNKSGDVGYRVVFRVISKPMISNLLNYPNPFSTSTAFVFTITGSEIPQQFKIQILTVTGRVVREITKDELGPLHIGRNITEYKWDGTDQFGQPLGNGVYLYRVVTTLNGKSMDRFKSEGDVTDQYFKNGYGKMYLMR